ncbi:hypothetical protein CDAR_539491 [Caerostris darwini]|uniref:Chromatin target of PRMT1 protein C-terminal domain-containing protein n=1 Tax=Caerostris darwini TaxID=1538125 RepID=A0AAV4MWS1_9ARAC|nr:hypothetical protein CDAR_539491 [Caerostris darwini]
MDNYNHLVDVSFVEKEKLPYVMFTDTPLNSRFSNPLCCRKKSQWRQRFAFDVTGVERVFFTNRTFLRLHNRFASYKNKTHDIIKSCLYNEKEAEQKLNRLMAKRRTVLLPKNDRYIGSFKGKFKFKVPIKFERQKQKTMNNYSIGHSKVQNTTAVQSISNSACKGKYLFRKKKMSITKEELDDELDIYMAEIKLKHLSNLSQEPMEEMDLTPSQEDKYLEF